MPRPSVVIAALAATLVAGVTVGQPQVAAAPADQARQRAFTSAAQEFGIPESVLLGVSYLESRWDSNAGRPSTSAGYGPMHLTDATTAAPAGSHHDAGTEDARGDESRPALHPRGDALDISAPALHTVDVAAKLTGTDPATLRSDAVQNIRGGAALLAQYQRELGTASTNPADWYGAVARYSGATDTGAAATFANEVFGTIAVGDNRVTDDGQHVALAADPALRPNTGQLDRLGLRRSNPSGTECPSGLDCEWIPAPYQMIGDGPADYGNHDLADRPSSQKIDYIVIHDTEGTWDGVLDLVQDPTYVSWNYSLRSQDGHIAQHVKAKDVAWHAGNWYINAKSIGLEHEGFAAQGSWFTESMYRSSAKLVKYLAAKYRVPLDRGHILGHDNVPGTTPATVKGMHWDPGPYWDWSHYFDLLGAPIHRTGNQLTGMVTIKPDYATNKPAFYGCDANAPSAPCPAVGSTSVVLHTQPSDTAPLLKDVGLHPDGSDSTMLISDHGSRVETGQQYAVAGKQGDWTAIWYLGQKGWLRTKDTLGATGLVAESKSGAAVPVFGRAYPEASAYPAGITPQDVVPLQYTLPAGQRYSIAGTAATEYYWATTFDQATHAVVRGKTKYVQIQFGHRIAFVKADDVRVTLSPFRH